MALDHNTQNSGHRTVQLGRLEYPGGFTTPLAVRRVGDQWTVVPPRVPRGSTPGLRSSGVDGRIAIVDLDGATFRSKVPDPSAGRVLIGTLNFGNGPQPLEVYRDGDQWRRSDIQVPDGMKIPRVVLSRSTGQVAIPSLGDAIFTTAAPTLALTRAAIPAGISAAPGSGVTGFRPRTVTSRVDGARPQATNADLSTRYMVGMQQHLQAAEGVRCTTPNGHGVIGIGTLSKTPTMALTVARRNLRSVGKLGQASGLTYTGPLVEEPGMEALPFDPKDPAYSALGVFRRREQAGAMPEVATSSGAAFPENQDSVFAMQTPLGPLLANIDGMGGYAGGRVAATAVRESLRQQAEFWIAEGCPAPDQFVGRLFENFQRDVEAVRSKKPELKQADAAATVCLITDQHIYGAGVGDILGRVYRAGGRVQDLTELGKAGDLGGGLTNAAVVSSSVMSTRTLPKVRIFKREPGDRVGLFSDGVYEDEGISSVQTEQERLGTIDTACTSSATPMAKIRSVLAHTGKVDDASAVVWEDRGQQPEMGYASLSDMWAQFGNTTWDVAGCIQQQRELTAAAVGRLDVDVQGIEAGPFRNSKSGLSGWGL